MVRIAINGFGRVGRAILQETFQKDEWTAQQGSTNGPRMCSKELQAHNINEEEEAKLCSNTQAVEKSDAMSSVASLHLEIVAINDPFIDTVSMIRMLKYDSTHGSLLPKGEDVQLIEKDILLLTPSQRKIYLYHVNDVARLPWSMHDIDVVCECSGMYTTKERAGCHLSAGARRVVISTNSSDAACVVLGANNEIQTDSNSRLHEALYTSNVLSSGCATTMCLAPFLAKLERDFDVDEVTVTVMHPATALQKAVDGANTSKNLRGGRGVLGNVVPAVHPNTLEEAIGNVCPSIAGKLSVRTYYVPTTIVLTLDVHARVRTKGSAHDSSVTRSQVEAWVRGTPKDSMWNGVTRVTDDEVVSSDFTKQGYTLVWDLASLEVFPPLRSGFRMLLWSNNEIGFAKQLLALVQFWMGIDLRLR